jgi:hypothetical protein
VNAAIPAALMRRVAKKSATVLRSFRTATRECEHVVRLELDGLQWELFDAWHQRGAARSAAARQTFRMSTDPPPALRSFVARQRRSIQ